METITLTVTKAEYRALMAGLSRQESFWTEKAARPDIERGVFESAAARSDEASDLLAKLARQKNAQIEERRLVEYICAHGHEAWVTSQNTIECIEVFSDGSEQLCELEPTMRAVRVWLGY